MPTKLTIFNKALQILAREPLESPDESGNTGRDLRESWQTVPQACLAEADWHFARKRVQLSRAGETPAFGYDYYYTLPSATDRMRLYRIYNYAPSSDQDPPFEDWVEENGKIATSASEIYLIYISWDQVRDKVGSWPDHFADYVSASQAELGAPTLNAEMIPKVKEVLKGQRKKSLALDASSQPPRRHTPGRWASAHRSGRHRVGQSGRRV